MARRYVVPFESVTVTVVQDLITVFGAAGKMCRIIAMNVACVSLTAPANAQLALRGRFLPTTLTAGSGGTTPTPQKLDPGDAAASFTAHVNDTTKTTTSGTAIINEEDGMNIYAGYNFMFPTPPVVGPSEAFVFELVQLGGLTTMVLSGKMIVEEIGG